jgi:hypothetical protein
MLRSALLSTVLLALLAPAAAAQLPVDPGTPPTTPAPGPATEAKLRIEVAGGMTERGKRYLLKGDTATVRGSLSPFVEGERVAVELFRGRKRVSRKTVEVRNDDGVGRFAVRFRVRGAGAHTVRATHDASARQQEATAEPQRFSSLVPSAGRGSGGVKVRLLQAGLARLGYVTSRGGRFDAATARAVLAFRKVNRMARNGSATRSVFTRVWAGRGGVKLKYPRAGKHVEAIIGRQVLVLANRGKAERIYHMSSGTSSTPTVLGSFRFYRKQPGTNSHGMVHSNYFIRGYAIHGYASVPNHPASHGCLRVPIPNSRSIDSWIRLGDRIFVYR